MYYYSWSRRFWCDSRRRQWCSKWIQSWGTLYYFDSIGFSDRQSFWQIFETWFNDLIYIDLTLNLSTEKQQQNFRNEFCMRCTYSYCNLNNHGVHFHHNVFSVWIFSLICNFEIISLRISPVQYSMCNISVFFSNHAHIFVKHQHFRELCH